MAYYQRYKKPVFWKNILPCFIAGAIFSSIVHYGCDDDIVDPPESVNNPPTAYLEVEPTQGQAPLEATFKIWGEDPDGIEDIGKYILEVTNPPDTLRIEKVNPFDTTLTLTHQGRYHAKAIVEDKGGETGSPAKSLRDTTEVFLHVDDVYTSAQLTGHPEFPVDIKYSSSSGDIDEVLLSIYRNNEPEPLLTKTITDKNFEKTFTYDEHGITKGFYEFEFKPTNPEFAHLERKDTVTVPDYPIQFYIQQLPEIDEGSQNSLNLEEKLWDPNPKGNPVSLTGARSTDGRTSVSVNGYEINITAMYDITEIPGVSGNVDFVKYGIEIEARSADGKTSATKTIDGGEIHNLLDVSGFLEDNEQHLPAQGPVKIFHYSETPLEGYKYNRETGFYLKNLGVGQTDSQGFFSKRLEHRVSDLKSIGDGRILVQARHIEPGTQTPKSYVRTKNIPAKDHQNLMMRVVPYEGLHRLSDVGVTPEDFRRHIAEVSARETLHDPPQTDPINWNPILRKWDLGIDPDARESLEEIIISKTHYDPEIEAFFNDETVDRIKSRLTEPEDWGDWFYGKITPDMITIVENHPAPWELPNDGRGKIYILPNIRSTGPSSIFPFEGYILRSTVNMKTDEDGYFLDGIRPRDGWRHFLHEGGHVSGQFGHAWTFDSDHPVEGRLSVMARAPASHVKTLLLIDLKQGKLRYEKSYIHGQGTIITYDNWGNKNYILGVNDVAGLKFFDE